MITEFIMSMKIEFIKQNNEYIGKSLSHSLSLSLSLNTLEQINI